MNFSEALTTKINPAFTINVPSSFAFAPESATTAAMNEILFNLGDLPVLGGDALLGFGALALLLLLIIAVIIARSGRRGAELAMAQAIRADELEQRLSEMLRAQSEATGRVDGADYAQHHGLTARAARAPRHHRQRPQKPHRPYFAGDHAARRARQQAVARRVRSGADGSDRPGRHAEGLIRIPVHALYRQAAGLRGVPPRPAAAMHRR